MKKIFALTLLFSRLALAGAEGHGGGAFVCRDSQGQIYNQLLAVETQDLWEGNNLFNLSIDRNPHLTWEVQADAALEKLKNWNPSLYKKTASIAGYVYNNLFYISDKMTIAPPQDAMSQFVKKDCKLEGAASFDERKGRVMLDRDLVTRMSTTDYAALMVHEALYKTFRLEGDKNSIRARRFVAFLFSQQPVVDFWAGLPHHTKYCETIDYNIRFALYKKNNELIAHFSSIDGYSLMAPAIAKIQDTSMEVHPFYSLYLGQKNDVRISLGVDNLGSPNLLIINPQSEHETFAITIGTLDDLSPYDRVECTDKKF